MELTAAKIRELMANAQRTIAERKVQLGLVNWILCLWNIPQGETNAANGINLPAGVIPDTETMDKMRRAAQLQAQITARLNSGILSNLPSTETEAK